MQNGDGSRVQLLVVDDHADELFALAKLLRFAGYDVKTADGCQSAIEVAERNRIDLVLCDVGLWDGDGCDLFQELRMKYDLEGIAVTGFGGKDDVQRCLDANFRSHVLKPVVFDNLLNCIADVLERTRLSLPHTVDSSSG